MKDLALGNSSQTLVKDGYGFRMTESVDEYVAQKLYIGLRAVLGEWYLNSEIGQPYFPEDDQKVVGTATLSASMKRFILSLDEVDSLTAFESSLNVQSRVNTVTWTVLLKSGSTVSGGL